MKPVTSVAIAVLIGVACVAVPSGAQAPAPQAPPGSVPEARRALAEGRTADALRMADTAARNAPRSRDAAALQIQILTGLEELPRALSAYDRYAGAVGKPDAALLAPIALQQLRITAAIAVDDPRLASEALERLARAGDAAAKARLQQISIDRAGTSLAVLADGALARLGDASASARLSTLVSSEGIRDKSTLIEAIARSGSRSAVIDLRALLQDPDPNARMAAMEALGRLGDRESIPAIRALLQDDYPPLRSRAVMTLARLGDSEVGESIARMRESPAGDVRLEALALDRTLSAADRRAATKAALADPDPLTRVRAAEAIAAEDPAAARAALVRVTGEADPTLRREAARALEALKPADLGVCRRLLADPSDWVRTYAAGAVLAEAGTK
jgi:HEAT repeat protein